MYQLLVSRRWRVSPWKLKSEILLIDLLIFLKYNHLFVCCKHFTSLVIISESRMFNLKSSTNKQLFAFTHGQLTNYQWPSIWSSFSVKMKTNRRFQGCGRIKLRRVVPQQCDLFAHSIKISCKIFGMYTGVFQQQFHLRFTTTCTMRNSELNLTFSLIYHNLMRMKSMSQIPLFS